MAELKQKIFKSNIFLLGLLVILIALPTFIKSPYHLGIVVLTIINITLVLSVNVIEGYTGKISLCQAAFYGMGAYTTAILTVRFGWSSWAALVMAALVPAGVAVIVGWPVLKLKGYYLAIATMGFQAIVSLVFLNWIPVTNGPFGIRGIQSPTPILGITFESRTAYYYLYLFMLIIIILFTRSLLNSRYGRAFLAICNDELASEAFAINATRYRVLSFAISSGIAGIAGYMFAHYFRYISPGSFSGIKSLDAVAMMIIGGTGKITGCIVGAVIYTFLPEVLRFMADYRTIILGSCITLVVLFMPEGIVGALEKLVDRKRNLKKKEHEVCDENK